MVKKYIIMAGGEYKHWEKPRHLSIIKGEELIARTIRLLRENGIDDISISTDNPIFGKFNVPILKHNNLYVTKWHDTEEGDWLNAFYPTDEPVCYVLGDVYFSPDAIKTIVNTDTDDIELFGSIPPFANNYIKNHIEAFALKVKNIKHLEKAIKETREFYKLGKFWRKPIIWELWEVIKNTPIQPKGKFIYNYTKINDYTCDIDWEEDIKKLNRKIGGVEMIKVEVIEPFTLGRFNELENIERASVETPGKLNMGDKFECTKDIADYLLGDNPIKRPVVKVIEVIPAKELPKEEPKEEIKVEKPKKKKKSTK